MPAVHPRLPAPYGSDARSKLLEASLRKHGGDAHALIEVLHTVQELFGFLPKDLLRYISQALDVPPSRVFGVATFYHYFSLVPKGRNSCVVCLGTACYVKRSADIVAALGKEYHIQPEQVTSDGALSLGVARCFGSCALAPAVLLNGQVSGNLTPESVVKLVRSVIASDNNGLQTHTSVEAVSGLEPAT